MRDQQSKREKLTLQLNYQLSLNQLVRKTLPEGPRSMLRAICDSLYHNTNYVNQLINLCKRELEISIENHTLPTKLNHLYQNPTIVADYIQNPDLSGFTKIHLELISKIYQRKIIIYYISEDYYLNCLIINDQNYTKSIQLSKIQNYYTPVFDKQIYDVINFVRQLIYEKLLIQSSKINQKEDKHPNKKRQHKKSLSACDELEYKQIFKTPIQPYFQYNPKSPLKKHQTNQDQLDDLLLINECNNNIPRKKSIIDDQYQFNKFKYQYPKYLNEDYRIHSQKVLSLHGVSQGNNTPVTKPSRAKQFQNDTNKRYSGRLKFFDENKNYGFIVIDQDQSDIFVHYDDLSKAGMTKQYMRTTKHGNIIRFQFSCMIYIGKYDKSRKAVELFLLQQQEYLP